MNKTTIGEQGKQSGVLQNTNSALQGKTNNLAASPTPTGIEPQSSGEPLSGAARSFFEPRFGHNFSQVRVHTDEQAQRSAANLNAHAYTLGQHIVFGSNAYAPGTMRGRSLLAHELAHTVQQQNNLASVQAKLAINSPTDSSEQAADAAAHTVMNSRSSASSIALRIREQLRMTALSSPVIQRAVNTWGGEFDTDKYELTADPGQDGVEIDLRFKPSSNVNAELIAMTQTARSREKGAPVIIGSGASKKALEERTIPSGEAGAGTRRARCRSS